MFLYRKIKGFSLIELMILLLVVSLVLAALMPIITKKHFRLPSLTSHGAYMCYYKEGKLREAKWAGKYNQQQLFDREAKDCVFEPPKKAAYFQILAIGGGGGGGDSGYTGGSFQESQMDTSKMDPFGLTQKVLDDAEIRFEDFDTYAGELYACANSIRSGNGGKIGYITLTPTEKCKKYGTKIEIPCRKRASGICSAKWEIVNGKGQCKVQNCHNEMTWEQCERTITWTEPAYCKEYKQYECEVGSEQKLIEGSCKPIEPYEGGRAVCGTVLSQCNKDTQKSGSFMSGTQRCHYEPCKVEETGEDCDYIRVPVMGLCRGECIDLVPEQELSRKEYYSCNPTTTTVYDGEPYIYTQATTQAQCTVNNIEGECMEYDENNPIEVTDESVCVNDEYSCSYSHSYKTGSGEYGGSNAQCSSKESIKGQLGLKLMENKPIYYDYTNLFGTGYNLNDGSRSKPYLVEKTAKNGKALCAGGKIREECAEGNRSFSQYTISSEDGSNSVTAKAYSAWRGGGGARRIIEELPMDKCGDTRKQDKYDYFENIARNGNCDPETSLNSTTTSCRCDGDGSVGYCLRHHNGNMELNGQYKYYWTLSTNYLGYGRAGAPGEFRTTIVRSLKNLDTTIKVGRGGAAAAQNTGGTGANGSPTSIGNILIAQGGEGGVGGVVTEAEKLPTYRKDKYDKENGCYNNTQYLEVDSETGNFVMHDCEGADKAACKYREQLGLSNTTTPSQSDLASARTQASAYCGNLLNNQNSYTYFKKAGGDNTGKYPTPTGIFSSFMNIILKHTNNGNILDNFIKFGRGGRGGTVVHKCWAGQHEIHFEDELLTNSVYKDLATAQSKSAYDPNAVTENRYVPDDCRNNWENIVASPGVDGALLIKW